MRTLDSCGRLVRADASFERKLRSRGRFVRADAPFARTLRSRGRSVRTDAVAYRCYLSVSAWMERLRQRSVRANGASAGVGHSGDSRACLDASDYAAPPAGVI